MSLSKNINPSLVLVQPRKTRPFITERLLVGRKESNQTNKIHILHIKSDKLMLTVNTYILRVFFFGGFGAILAVKTKMAKILDGEIQFPIHLHDKK